MRIHKTGQSVSFGPVDLGAAMNGESKRFNSKKVKYLIFSRYGRLSNFAKIYDLSYPSVKKILQKGTASPKTIEKFAKCLDIKVSDISDMNSENKPYWWVSDQDYPVDTSFCAKCWIWNTTCKCCDYLERKGQLIPDGHIVVHPDGRHTCKYREIGQRSAGPYKNSSEF